MSLIESTALILTLAAVTAAAVIDVFYRRIPNVFVGVMLLSVCAYVLSRAPGQAVAHLISGLLTLLSCMLLFSRKIIGGGDAKMMAVLALWFTPQQLFLFVLWTLICGGVLGGLFVLALIGRLVVLKFHPNLRLPSAIERAGMPYGVASAAGFAIAAWRVH